MWNRSYFTSLGILTLLVGFLVGSDCDPQPPANSLRLLDANGQDLGMGTGGPAAFNEHLGVLVSFDEAGNLVAGLSDQIRFTEPDCQGLAYVDVTRMNNAVRIVWTNPSEPLRYFVPSGLVLNDVIVRSQTSTRGESNPNDPSECENQVPPPPPHPFQFMTERDLPFEVPVAWPLHSVPTQ